MRSGGGGTQWYVVHVSGTLSIRVGNKGRLVVPFEIRAHQGWVEGTVLIAVEREDGVLLISREAALATLRSQAAGRDLVGELIAERRAAAAREDAGVA